ncbi:MAG: signal recognition particle protein [Sulfolobus sp.]|nr:signal recognition particle protein [Sulfolobus sp.]
MLESLRDAVRKFLTGSSSYEKAVNDFLKDLQVALIKADVNVRVVYQLTERIKKRLQEERPPAYVNRTEWFLKIVYEELVSLFGGERKPNVLPPKLPYVIMLVGVQGSGKTTTAGKLAYFYKRKGYKVALVGADVYRPAALDQLTQLGEKIGVPVYGEKDSKDAVGIAKRGVEKFIKDGYQIVIVDTAGRHGYGQEKALMDEMKAIKEAINPDETILVIDASIGQKAYDLASKFHEASPIGSIIVTKLDGTAKGGGALTAVAVTGAPIKFIGTGEKIDELEPFEPPRFVSRILGMGDIQGIVERLRSVDEYQEVEKEMEDILEGKSKLTYRILYKQLKSLKKGGLSKLLEMIPGFGTLFSVKEDHLKLGEEQIKRFLAIMDSMTYKELDEPSLIHNRSRMRRIAEGAGVTVDDVKALIRHLEMTNNMIKMLKKRKNLARLLGRYISSQ